MGPRNVGWGVMSGGNRLPSLMSKAARSARRRLVTWESSSAPSEKQAGGR